MSDLDHAPHTRHRVSKIDRLPDEIKTQLNILLRDGSMSQTQIRDEINQIIVESGALDEDVNDPEYIKRNALSRYAQNFRKGMEKYQHAQQLTKRWVDKFGDMPQTDIARSLIEIGKSQIFDFQMTAIEENADIDMKTMGQMALAIKRLQEAQSGSMKLETEIRKQAMSEAASTAESAAKQLGLTADGAMEIKKLILGL